MPVQPTFPGVYVLEAPSGARAIAGVSTSVAAFVGMTARGPVNVPTKIFSPREFEAKFGGAIEVGELPDQVRQFFLNGGGTAWIVRNAAGATDGATMTASSTLRSETGADVLIVTAKDAGEGGNLVRVEIDYETDNDHIFDERTFNMKVFRLEQQKDGSFKPADEATYSGLSMDPKAMRYAPVFVTAQSPLVSVASVVPAPAPAPTDVSLSQSGLIFSDLPVAIRTRVTASAHQFMISINGRPPVAVSLAGPPAANPPNDLADMGAHIEDQINDALTAANENTSVTVVADDTVIPNGTILQITSTDGPVVIASATLDDIAANLRLGVANGGLEYDSYSQFRPAPNGYVTRAHGSDPFSRIHAFASAVKPDMGNWDIAAARPANGPVAAFVAAPAGTTMSDDVTPGANVLGSFAEVRRSLAEIAIAIKNHLNGDFNTAVHGLRLRIRPNYGNDDSDQSILLSNLTAPTIFTPLGRIGTASDLPTNVLRYSIGLPEPAPAPQPGGAYRTRINAGSDGAPGLPADYDYSYDKLARADGIFNLLVLPRAETSVRQSDTEREALWAPASAFCKKERAFLIVDPPSDAGAWSTAAAAVTGVKLLRAGIVQDHAAIYWSRVRATGSDGKPIIIDPSGTMAGVYAAIDVRRGVWKAPAGLEAMLIGVKGLEYPITNEENGITNPEALNTLRLMVSGPVAWGARTMIGYEGAPDQDYKYVPVRRLALMIEESLYTGLQPYVFEPNDEPLWGQIRLSVGAFMNGLFLDGAFAGKIPREAYYVACGPSTTTPEEIALGIINIEVGFAPLRPAEFVILTLRQIVNQSGAQGEA